MKITKSQLKQLIKEELETECTPEVMARSIATIQKKIKSLNMMIDKTSLLSTQAKSARPLPSKHGGGRYPATVLKIEANVKWIKDNFKALEDTLEGAVSDHPCRAQLAEQFTQSWRDLSRRITLLARATQGVPGEGKYGMGREQHGVAPSEGDPYLRHQKHGATAMAKESFFRENKNVKITKNMLKQIIREELEGVLNEEAPGLAPD